MIITKKKARLRRSISTNTTASADKIQQNGRSQPKDRKLPNLQLGMHRNGPATKSKNYNTTTTTTTKEKPAATFDITIHSNAINQHPQTVSLPSPSLTMNPHYPLMQLQYQHPITNNSVIIHYTTLQPPLTPTLMDSTVQEKNQISIAKAVHQRLLLPKPPPLI
ncbi:hypothetical protein KC19_2G110300 [Ceratodon purpureus]|uniref:Uncharacterized protein n=1 Tax=Ceratodon purpureus TaxID=3225 RepID=A0A8T0IU84_CERPU|nr:hypothetical protein KC19_2G110300 [Ceratodon purpureus]